MESICGQVVHRRNVNSRMAFFDVLANSGNQPRRASVLLKEGICHAFQDFKRGETKLSVGDEVKAVGKVEEDGTFVAVRCEITAKWRDKHPNEAFAPIPPLMLEKVVGKRCKYWDNTGKCPNGQACHMEHMESRHLKVNLDNDHSDFVSRHQRARVFAEWIVQEFQPDKDNLILDVAGGKGDLAFELALKHGLRCSVVDPRGVAFQHRRKYQRKLLKKSGKSEDLRHLYTSINANFGIDFFTVHSELVDSVKLVLGLHPDQATEPLMDACLAFGIAFAVIPCCVFAHANHWRRLKNGDFPHTYDHFVKYLSEKDARIQLDQLSFQGRNQVLYFKPS